MCGMLESGIQNAATNAASIPLIIIPSQRQFFANFGSSSLITKYAITPPII